MKIGQKPFSHQIETTKFLLMNLRAFNFSDLGTGKTLSSLWAADFLLCNDKIKKILIVCPLSTMQSVWGREIFTNFPHRKYAIAHGNKSYRESVIAGKADFIIINHDGVVIMEEALIRAKFDLIIIDELTAFKKHTTNRSKAMINICRNVKAVHALTGAPTPNGPTEAFGQAKVVNPNNPFLPKYYTAFRDSVEQQVGPFLWLPKPNAPDIVNRVLQPAIRFERDKCLDLPPCQYEDIIVEFTSEQREVYDKMKKELLVEYAAGEITAVNAAVKVMKLLQIAAGSVKDDEGNAYKLDSSTRDDELWRIFEETGKTKLVVFCAFRASIEHLVEFFRKKGARAECIYGSVDHKVRANHIKNFQDGDLQVLIIQPQSSAHGITLTAANVIVWHSLVPSGEIYVQANGRITRAGQTRKQLIIHLIGCQAEKRLLSIVQNKESNSHEVLDMFAVL
jgi:SNF2 family DNA or RNA helicase